MINDKDMVKNKDLVKDKDIVKDKDMVKNKDLVKDKDIVKDKVMVKDKGMIKDEDMIKEFMLEGLCCGHCAAKIEREAAGLQGIKTSNLDFMSKVLRLELEDVKNGVELQDKVKSIVKSHDAKIKVQEVRRSQPGCKAIYLNGLDCPDCAGKIQRKIEKLEGVREVQLDFVSQKLTVEVEDEKNLPGILRQATKLALEVEPDLDITYTLKKEAITQDKKNIQSWIRKGMLGIGAILFLIGILFPFAKPVELSIFLVSYILIGGEVVFQAVKNISKGRIFDENFFMGVATIGAFLIGEYPEGVAVMLFYQVGEAFQSLSVNRSRRSISELMDIRPDYANLKLGEEIQKVSPDEVGVGDVIVVKPGEKIPLDGIVLEGFSALDTAALTGESMPRDVKPKDEVVSGSINQSGVLLIEVTKAFGDSTVSKILDLVQNASSKKAPTEAFITKFARYYTPIVTFAAVLIAVIPPLVIPGAIYSEWIYRALAFLVVSCPCALVISVPLSFFGGIGGASRNGVLIKGSNYMEALNYPQTIVFDKTGTLTKGVFNVQIMEGMNGFSEEEVLRYAAFAESFSNHPIGQSVVKAYGREIPKEQITNQQEIPGLGIQAVVAGKKILAGNAKLMREQDISYKEAETVGTVIHVAIDGLYAGYLVIADEVKADSKRALKELKQLGVKKTVMLTGDNKKTGVAIANQLGIDEVYTDLLPNDKVEQFEELAKKITGKGKILFVGDGVNDAPVLARADIGVAMGALGSDAAIEAADVVLMTDEPSKIVTAIRIARKTKAIVWQNIVFALGVKIVILVLATLGIATMWEAVFGDVGVAIIAIFNAMRAMRMEKIRG